MYKKRSTRFSTSWQGVAPWYKALVGKEGQYYHQKVVIPNALRLLGLTPGSSLLDLACGQGILERSIFSELEYTGLDLSKDLIKEAERQKKSPKHHFKTVDVTRELPLVKDNFTHACIILALQNIEEPAEVIRQAAKHLILGGKLLVVLNHPCFRIPRQSSWEIDPKNKLEYRRINRYLSPLKVPIQASPSRSRRSPITWSFHHSLSDYSQMLQEAGFCIVKLEEWVSDKTSIGKAAKMENRSRREFPLFLAILAEKRY